MNDIKILFSKTVIRKRVLELAKVINADYKNKEIMVIPVLEGGMFFAADIIRELKMPLTVHTINVSSYHGKEVSSGHIDMKQAIVPFCNHKNILIIDDIFDTGLTMSTLKNMFKLAGSDSIKTCTLLNKQIVRKINTEPDYYGFKIKNEFVIGYGLDLNSFYRNLPYVGIKR
jgi:hypoxanthine phosphoribosyltransferase